MRRGNIVVIVLIGALLVVAFASQSDEGRQTPQVGIPVFESTNSLAPDSGQNAVPAHDDQATPLLPPAFDTPTPTLPSANAANQGPTPTVQAVRASDLQTPDAVEGGGAQAAPGVVDGWNPPPQEVPIARHPQDHYWFIRPVGSNANNFGLPHYAFGSDGPANDLRIHHGIDLANPIGVEVYAGASGTVTWAGKGHFNGIDSITAYGNTVSIEHDFGFQGESVYTLYAHLSAVLVHTDQRVEAGQVIGLIGNTGQVTGPHVHFEVRVGRNSYYDVRNPELWVAPYVGTGVIAGRLETEDGQIAVDAPITVVSLDSGQTVYHATTYAGFGVTSDEYWNETFTIPDMPAGRYLVSGRFNGRVYLGEVDVIPGTTNWVDLSEPEDPSDIPSFLQPPTIDPATYLPPPVEDFPTDLPPPTAEPEG